MDRAADELELRAAPMRAAMIAGVRDLGVADDWVLDALTRVPRHLFVDRFWRTPPGLPWRADAVRQFDVTGDMADDVLRAVHDPSAALVTRGAPDRPAATSSVSAPVIVATMLAELELRPGLRVLEIGTGSGYNAALLAELVGDPALVTTVDIDPSLVQEAAARLARLGYGSIDVRCADGIQGAADRAPFDRIVATVGCVDVAPAWLAQLDPNGFLLLPLEYGGLHPRARVHLRAGTAHGQLVGQSGFVRIQGPQGAVAVWPTAPSATATALGALGAAIKLPAGFAAAIAPPDEGQPQRVPGRWDFGLYLAIRDRRCIVGPGLADQSSTAVVADHEVRGTGAEAELLCQRIISVAEDWLAAGRPSVRDYRITFHGRGSVATVADSPSGPWVISRVDHDEEITLDDRTQL